MSQNALMTAPSDTILIQTHWDELDGVFKVAASTEKGLANLRARTKESFNEQVATILPQGKKALVQCGADISTIQGRYPAVA